MGGGTGHRLTVLDESVAEQGLFIISESTHLKVTSHVPISIFFPVGLGFSSRDSTVVRPFGIFWAEFGGRDGYDVFSLVEAAAGPASIVSNTFQPCMRAVSSIVLRFAWATAPATLR